MFVSSVSQHLLWWRLLLAVLCRKHGVRMRVAIGRLGAVWGRVRVAIEWGLGLGLVLRKEWSPRLKIGVWLVKEIDRRGVFLGAFVVQPDFLLKIMSLVESRPNSFTPKIFIIWMWVLCRGILNLSFPDTFTSTRFISLSNKLVSSM